MVKIDVKSIDKQIDKYGEVVEIEDFTRTYSPYGDAVLTQSTSEEIRAIFNTYGKSSNFNSEGIFNEGDVSFFFKGGQDNVTEQNVIIRANGERWKIVRVSKHYLNGNRMVQEAAVKNE
jgi:hypothetical protein